MRTNFILCLLVTAIASCSSVPAVCDNGACGDGGNEGGNEGGVDVPKNCDLMKEPKDSPDCIDDSVGVFVDVATGKDTNPGTKGMPVKTITHALAIVAPRPRVYVCAGTYPEDVKITLAASLYGGLTCNTWSYSGTKPVIGSDAHALTVDSVMTSIVIADLDIHSQPAAMPSESSIAAFVNNSNVTFLRDKLTAEAGKDGADPTQKTQTMKAADGINSMGNPGGALCKNTCADGDSIGGVGGDVGSNNADAGSPSYGGTYPNNGGAGQGIMLCGSGGAGGTGVQGPNGMDQPGAAAFGTLTGMNWQTSSGIAGKSGARGQGGGGGGARAGGGGGGGCGGCGGAGGDPGGGGGSSLALVSVTSTMMLTNCSLTAAAAGRGGNGAKGQLGQPPGGGGSGFAAAPSGCAGGDGAQGGGGGSGGGGAGGLSVGILYKGNAPMVDTPTMSTIMFGTRGTKGLGGTSPTNDGIDGDAKATMMAP